MNMSRTVHRLAVTWGVMIPLLLVITFVISPGTLISVIAAAAISPLVHSAVGLFYRDRPIRRGDYASRIFGDS